MSPKVLFVLTSHATIDAANKPTGWYLPEFAHPYYKLRSHCEIVVASIAGGAAPLDPGSVQMSAEDTQSQMFLASHKDLWENTTALQTFLGKWEDFAALLFVGGHGAMYDFATSDVVHRLVREFYENGKIVAAVCHGPAALVNVKLEDGTYLIAGQKVTGFSNAEEDAAGLSDVMPFPLETELSEKAGVGLYEAAETLWAPKVVVSGKIKNLITGQNPASAGPIGDAILKAIRGEIWNPE